MAGVCVKCGHDPASMADAADVAALRRVAEAARALRPYLRSREQIVATIAAYEACEYPHAPTLEGLRTQLAFHAALDAADPAPEPGDDREVGR